MKQVFLSAMSLLVGGLFALNVNAQEITTSEAAKPSLAEITFDKDVHDYGTIKQGANGVYEFKFKNTGKEPLIISNAQGSCGCTVPDWPKQPIRPGETSAIKVSYDTKRIGAINKTVTIYSNARTNSEKVIRITGNVEASSADAAPVKPASSGTPAVKH
jgi:hypothetical protein